MTMGAKKIGFGMGLAVLMGLASGGCLIEQPQQVTQGVLPTTECMSDSDCAANQHCATLETTCAHDPGPDGIVPICDAIAVTHQCEDNLPPPPNGCRSNADCALNQQCALPVYAEGTPEADQAPGSNSAPGSSPAQPPFPTPAPDLLGECVDVPPPGCNSNADCGTGFICSFNAFTGCGDAVDAGVPVPTDAAVDGGPAPGLWGGGECVPAPTPFCSTDSDCPSDQECIIAAVDPCPPGAMCANLVGPTGTCEPRHVVMPSCSSDSDCSPEQYCVFQPVVDCCPPGAECLVACDTTPSPGICEARPVTTSCTVDSDCTSGQTCEIHALGACPPGVPCDPFPTPSGICVDAPPAHTLCVTSNDCTTGQTCVPAPLGIACLSDAPCPIGYCESPVDSADAGVGVATPGSSSGPTPTPSH